MTPDSPANSPVSQLVNWPGLAALASELAACAAASGRTFIVGLCGAQGSGKSTVASVLQRLLEERGVSAVAVSLDDFYLTRKERVELAQRVHPLLRTRGAPGTHDVQLAMRTLDALGRAGRVAIPRFDKGLDDRARAEIWPSVDAPVRIVLFEGWCVGAVPEPEGALETPINELERTEDREGIWRKYVNAALADEYQTLFSKIDLLVLLQAPSFDVVYDWRHEQEQELRKRMTSIMEYAMTDEELEYFIAHYERLTRWILEEMPHRADVVIRLDEQRNVVDCTRR